MMIFVFVCNNAKPRKIKHFATIFIGLFVSYIEHLDKKELFRVNKK